MRYPYLKYVQRTAGIASVILCLLPKVYAQTIIPNTATVPGAGTKTVNPLPAGYGSGITVNYVRAWEAEKPYTNDTFLNGPTRTVQEVKQSTQYFDGLGRPLQTVAKGVSPNGFDMVSPVVYDAFGRELFKYLPFVSTGSNGNFKTDPFTEQNNFMKGMYNPTNDVTNGEKYFYGQTDYEASPLNRVTKAYAPGNNWVGDGVGTGMQYLVNDALDSVRIWSISLTGGAVPTSAAAYGAGLLYETVSTDEQGNKVVEYKDKEGHVILKKIQLWASPAKGHSGWLCTYYVYDDLGNLRYVIQPKGTDWLKANSWVFDNSVWASSQIAKELCFSYEYDSRNRMIIKRVAGAGEVWIVYDARDRMVMTQDSALRVQGKWLYTDYDSLNRPILSGLWTDANNRSFHQNLAGASVTYPTPSTGYTVLTQSYYDDYTWVSGSGSGLSSTAITTYNGNTSYFYTADNTTFPYPQAQTATNLTRGMPTGTKVNVVGSSTYLYAVSFYDDRARAIETQRTNNSGAKDTAIMQYSFSGQVVRTLLCHGKGGTNPQNYKVLNKMSYDAAGRVIQVNKKIGNSPEVIVTKNQYDELGQLKKKDIGQVRNSSSQNTYTTNPIDSLRFIYNVRGWLRGINKDYARGENSAVNWFGMELCYDFGFNATQLNGNIAGMRWRSGGDGEQRSYGYSYDAINRIVKADFTQYTSSAWGTSAGIDYSLRGMSYDQNGNILTMSQMGVKINASQLIDSLVYSYNTNSNKLNYVTDKVNDANSLLGDFKEINNNTTQDYYYDGNGNLKQDNNKNISSITYNYLNLSNVVTVTGKGTITYTYDAAGNKLKKVVTDNSVTPVRTTTTDYLGLFTYQNDTLQFVATEEGRARPAKRIGQSDTMYYDYFEKDHLGNVRVTLTDELQSDYYPNLTFEGTSGTTEVTNQDAVWDDRNGNTINVISSRTARPGSFGTSTTNGSYAMLVKKSTGAVGATKLLKVMSGDVLNVSVDYYYTTASANNTGANGLNTFVSSLINILTNSETATGIVKGNAGVVQSYQSGDGNVTSFFSPENGTGGTAPKAYLHVLLFDERFVFDNTNSYVQQVGGSGYTVGTKGTITLAQKAVKKNGYAYIYFSNETDELVYFDNFMLTHVRGPLLEDNAYGVWGGVLSAISSQSIGKMDNKYQYNGKEKQEKEWADGSGIEWYDYGARMYDAQVGRWGVIDPLVEDGQEATSPYTYVDNNPISRIDPDGRKWEDKDGKNENKKEADGIRDGLNKVNDKLASKNAKLQVKLAKAEAQNKANRVQKLNDKITNNNQRIGVNKETINTLNSLENDQSKTFRFGNDVTETEKDVNGEPVTIQVTTFARDANGTYVINNSGHLENKAHEITHAGQILNGLVDVKAGTTTPTPAAGVTFADLEHGAYKASYGVTGDKKIGFGSVVSKICGLDDPNFNKTVDEGLKLKKL